MTDEGTPAASRPRRRTDGEVRRSGRTRTGDDGRTNERQSDDDARLRAHSRNGGRVGATVAARRAAQAVAELTGHDVETVISIEPSDEGWKVGVEVVEIRRIPDSADILASYEVRLNADGELVSYRRIQRYARGQLHGGSR